MLKSRTTPHGALIKSYELCEVHGTILSPGPIYLPEEGGFRSDFQKEELRHGSEATEPAANQLILPEVIVWTVTTELHNNKRHGHLLHKDLV